MRLSVKTLAAMLIGLALAVFQIDSDAQSQRNSRSASKSRSESTSRAKSSGSYKRSSDINKPVAARPASKPKSDRVTPSKPKAEKPSVNRPGNKPSVNRPPERPNDRPSVNRPPARPNDRPSVNRPPARPNDRPSVNRPPARPDGPRPVHHPKPPRVHPKDRGFKNHHHLSHHWSPKPHYYGYRIRSLPLHAHRYLHGGVTYYCYDNIWYRPYGGHYVVCRPPFGTLLAANLIADIALTAVKISYYNSLAQANANLLAANSLGVVQNYADKGASYYYQDGVFYTITADGKYMVIAPPAGALVESLPEDYEVVTLSDGNVYYKVDNTIYRMTVNEGKPYFEVVGQM